MTFDLTVFRFRFAQKYAPVSGEVVEINQELNSQPGLLNKSPEKDGLSKCSFDSLLRSFGVFRLVVQDQTYEARRGGYSF